MRNAKNNGFFNEISPSCEFEILAPRAHSTFLPRSHHRAHCNAAWKAAVYVGRSKISSGKEQDVAKGS
jgi:hypothetical protein